jgi:hypothetical protein
MEDLVKGYTSAITLWLHYDKGEKCFQEGIIQTQIRMQNFGHQNQPGLTCCFANNLKVMDLQTLTNLFASTYNSDPNVRKASELQIRKVIEHLLAMSIDMNDRSSIFSLCV